MGSCGEVTARCEKCDARMCRKRSVVEKAWGSNSECDCAGSRRKRSVVWNREGCAGLCSDVQGDVKLKLSRNGVIENGTGF